MTRIYVPATLDDLRSYVKAGSVPAEAERFVAADEDEESEYDALLAAADASAALLAGPGRRVVVVGEVADPDAAVDWSRVQAVHADPAEVDPTASGLPDPGWYATQEIADLLAD
jgi:hypothetical protein